MLFERRINLGPVYGSSFQMIVDQNQSVVGSDETENADTPAIHRIHPMIALSAKIFNERIKVKFSRNRCELDNKKPYYTSTITTKSDHQPDENSQTTTNNSDTETTPLNNCNPEENSEGTNSDIENRPLNSNNQAEEDTSSSCESEEMPPRGLSPNFDSFASPSPSPSTTESESKYSSKTSFECEFCTKTYSKWKRFNKHKKRHYAKKQFSCKTCNKVLTSRTAWSYHVKSVHERCKDFKCSYCDKGFVTKQHLLIHIKNHKYVCHFCAKSFTARFKLRAHKECHRIFECHICDKKFFRNHRLQRHIEVMHPGAEIKPLIKDETPPPPIKNEPEMKGEEILPSCQEEEEDENTMSCGENDDEDAGSDETDPPIPTAEECQYCREIFASKDDLEHHWKLTGENLFICARCLHLSEGDIAFSLHLLTHNEEKIFMCTLCSKTFVNMELLEDHFTTHAGLNV
ncbi:zinc finger and BTB domain-containing protein 41-like isoform X2 [Planococcus citri]|uniref:zinc finger and BTB domain-containing protein 41-like isoform X2 n=1 Tax=Planococcus citri TaxID=170843 RepID=UPI0031F82FCE